MIKWLHHLLDPHCPDCIDELREMNVCDSCEILKSELERLRLENDKLLDRLLEPPRVEEKIINTEELKPLTRGHIPFGVRRQMLEAEDREKARLEREYKKQTEELENQMLESKGKDNKNAIS